MPIRPVRLLACACVIAALAPASACTPALAASFGEGSAFSELSQGGQEAPAEETVTNANQSSTSNSSSGTVLLLSLVAAGLLLAGIAFVILRDAHRVAPVPDGEVGAAGRSGRDPAAQLRKRRARAKAARRQRKRNR